ncbi:MAG: bifunctional GTP diphosphokinase/guanosine-3',5'-bis pyrophosphate 3'-pyrophosphohydrolase [Pseudomonadota bacterium]|nr:bifunctional GTP diphosphokinase/guanosine-3',5'-bis pyrophosphate 3'-pyrophosphohydrolase [Pseudomonadota bacterium]
MAVTVPSDDEVPGVGSEESRFGPEDLRQLLATYLGPEEIADVDRAYAFGARAHEGQRRLTGEPYIYHPLAVARILAEMRLDHRSIMAAILHDVIEDTPTAKEHIAEEFDQEVADLVDGVSKLTQINNKSKAEAQAESFRKMMLAMVEDIRVILIKLADRVHNMRTLGVMRPEKRRRIARETLGIYGPIANRLGMNSMRLELEDLGFAALYPLRYRVLSEAMKRARGNRKRIIQQIEETLSGALAEEGIEAQVAGREKHLYSLYQKMRNKELSFAEVLDMYACRIIVDKVDTCYRALGVAHNLYKPVPGRFKDYIAIPKANGYQSIHTVLFGPHGVPIEVQIRTREMEYVAEAGVAAHWQYKLGDGSVSSPQQRAREWLHTILEMQRRAGNSMEFLENVKVDLFPDEIYVFTPKGNILRLPVGATPVDFAYAVHTDVGNRCAAAKVDRRLVPLSTSLRSGQTVEVITSDHAHPNPVWLNFIVTARARANIRHYLKNLREEEAAALGRRLLERSLAPFQLSLEQVAPAVLDQVVAELDASVLDELLVGIGLGQHMAPLVARRILDKSGVAVGGEVSGLSMDRTPLAIKGTEGMVVTYGRCCHPIPGDPILGFLSAGRGIVIHKQNCHNVGEFRKHPDKWIDVEWEEQLNREFPVEIRLEAENQRGVLAVVAAAISQMGSNIEHVSVEEKFGNSSALNFTVTVRDRRHLARIMRRLRSMPSVIRITRAKS